MRWGGISMNAVTKGSCLCGKVQFEIEGEFENFFLCHCKYCQKDTGSANAANLFSTTAKLNWISGEKMVTSFHLPKSRHCKSFCATCGSAMPSLQEQMGLLVVPAGALDDDISIRPTAHIFESSKATWEKCLDSIARFEGLPQ